MKQFSVILLIASFLWSTSGIGMLMHFCEGKLKHSSFYAVQHTESCHPSCCKKSVEPVKACCILKAKIAEYEQESCQKKKKDCCQDSFFYLKIAEEFLSLDTAEQLVLIPSILPISPHETLPISTSFSITHAQYAHPTPPLLRDVRVLFQQFRL